MKVSIATISYNQVQYVEEAIRSVLEQDYNNIEYIVVDAGSTDGTRELITSKYKERISKIIFETDNGPAEGLNKGFRHATGEVFAFLNSDDILLPGAVRKITGYFVSNPQTDVIMGNGFKIDSNNKVLKKVYTDGFSLQRYIYGCVTIMQPSIFFRREAYEKAGGFNELNKTCWDGELILDFGLQNCNFLKINEFLSCFRIHPGGNSGMGENNPRYDIWLKDKERLFKKATGKKFNFFDSIVKIFSLIIKWGNNPTALLYNISLRSGLIKELKELSEYKLR